MGDTYKVCTLSIQTVVCGFTSENRSENVTATLKGVYEIT